MPSSPRPSALGPRARANEAPRALHARGPRRPPAAATVVGLLASGDPQRLLDLGDDPCFRVEELLVHALPAAEHVDREQARRRRKLAAGHARDDRAVALGRPGLL